MSSNFIILGDVHIGARNASPVLCEYQLKFFEEELIPYMNSHKIDTILQLGDLFDSRKFSNHIILHKWKTRLFDVLEKNKIKMITLLGNHDIASKNTLEVNSTSLFLNSYKSIEIVDEPTIKNICGTDFLLIPWICSENQIVVDAAISETTALYCAGHFEFSGFEMQKGVLAHGSEDVNKYEKFDLVLSGHYHTKNKKKNVLYTGVPYEMTWADYGDQKGFHVFDSKNHKLTFVKTVLTLFNKITYNDKDVEPINKLGLKDTYVKVVVSNKTDPYKFEKFITNILLQNPADLKITDIEVDFEEINVDDELKLEDTKTLINKFVDQVETCLDKKEIKEMMQTLYMHALETTE